MLDFDAFLMRHGESAVQALVEQMECSQGLSASNDSSLEDRWFSLMAPSRVLPARCAA